MSKLNDILAVFAGKPYLKNLLYVVAGAFLFGLYLFRFPSQLQSFNAVFGNLQYWVMLVIWWCAFYILGSVMYYAPFKSTFYKFWGAVSLIVMFMDSTLKDFYILLGSSIWMLSIAYIIVAGGERKWHSVKEATKFVFPYFIHEDKKTLKK